MKRTIEQIDVKGKRVLLRVDFNVPLDEHGNITDDTRIIETLPTIKYLLSKGAKLIICSHLGRPKGERNMKYSLAPVARRLIDLLLNKVYFARDTVGKDAVEKAKKLGTGEVLLLENLRFHAEEEKNDPIFASKLAALAEVYVNDAFGTSHRAHASIVGVARLLPNAIGFLMGKEVNTLLSVLQDPERPFVAVLGGAKISDKIYVVMNLLRKADTICIGGGMAYTFLKAKGHEVGASLVDEEKLELAANILKEAETRGVRIILPVDHKCATVFSPSSKAIKVKKPDIPKNLIGLDIGNKTIRLFKRHLEIANTVIWNGPLGVFEFDNFSKGTKSIAKYIAKLKSKTIIGGGDSIAAVNKTGKAKNIWHISTGGGASLKLLEGTELPGVDVIEDV
ncbi:MAG: phosphoglycerate kinase [Christensenellales bacterium]